MYCAQEVVRNRSARRHFAIAAFFTRPYLNDYTNSVQPDALERSMVSQKGSCTLPNDDHCVAMKNRGSSRMVQHRRGKRLELWIVVRKIDS